jgi:hypothetical protein
MPKVPNRAQQWTKGVPVRITRNPRSGFQVKSADNISMDSPVSIAPFG